MRRRFYHFVIIAFLSITTIVSQIGCGGTSHKKTNSTPTETETKEGSAHIDTSIRDQNLSGCEEFNSLAQDALEVHVEYTLKDFPMLRQKALVKLAKDLEAATPPADPAKCTDLDALNPNLTKDYGTIFEEMLKRFMEEMDPHSTFRSEQQATSFFDMLNSDSKELAPGIIYDLRSAHQWVPPKAWRAFYVLKDSPAVGALNPDDEFTFINGIKMENMSITDYNKALAESDFDGKSYSFKLKNNPKLFSFPLTEIKTPSVVGRTFIHDGIKIGWIRISIFASKSHKEFTEVLKSLEPNVAGYVIDLRNNPGGVETEVVGIVDDLVDTGPQLFSYSRFGIKSLTAQTKGQLTRKPIAFLTDAKSASGSDLMAGMLRVSRAAHLGETTYGKATAFDTFSIEGKYINGALSITKSMEFIFDGSTPQGDGLKAHLELPDPLMQEAIEMRRNKKIDFLLRESEYPNALRKKTLPVGIAYSPPPQSLMENILKNINAQEVLRNVQTSCDWDEKDCQKELALEIVKHMVEEKLVF